MVVQLVGCCEKTHFFQQECLQQHQSFQDVQPNDSDIVILSERGILAQSSQDDICDHLYRTDLFVFFHKTCMNFLIFKF